MNTNDHENDALRWQLRSLRRELEPSRDLWPDIAARIAATPQTTYTRRKRRAWLPMAMAASLLLALGVFWRLAPAPAGDMLIRNEAAAMSQQYQNAFDQLASAQQTSAHPEVTAALQDLDHSAAQIRNAIERSPDSRFLLEQLRRTYARRLALTQRATDLT
jgi:hypothetical protein